MSSPISPELQSKIAAWRHRSAEGTLTLEEMKEIVILLRAGRVTSAQSPTTTKRKKAIAAIPKAEDMLADLDSM